MEIQHSLIGRKGKFYFAENGEAVAEMVYIMEDKSTILILHTEVSEHYEGKGLGRKLVQGAVDYARKNSLKIEATCPYAKKVLDNTPEYNDVYIFSQK